MKLARRPRRVEQETIIALIDVVFFLLVFFMLIGRMDATAPFEVAPPLAATGSDMPGGGATVSVAAGGSLAIDGIGTTQEDLLDAIARALEAEPDVLVRINADRSARLGDVLPLSSAIEALGARNVVLVVMPAPSD